MTRIILLLLLGVSFAIAWKQFSQLSLTVVGHPTSTGLIQSQQEEPFFKNLGEQSGLSLHVTYTPVDSIGLMDDHQLPILQRGYFDLVSLRFLQNSDLEPSLQGIDLVGVNSDFITAQEVVAAYSDTVDQYLQSQFDSKLLGVWSLGPQEIYCRDPIQSLRDLKGRKVRIGSATLSTFVSELGGTPVVMRFEDSYNALAIDLIDCAVTGAPSANFNGWPEHTNYYFPLAVHFGLNGYVMSLEKWNSLSSTEQAALQDTFNNYIEQLWQFSIDLHEDAASCNTGNSCRVNRLYDMTLVQPSPADVRLLRSIMENQALTEWGARCDAVHPGCYNAWQETVGNVLGLEREAKDGE